MEQPDHHHHHDAAGPVDRALEHIEDAERDLAKARGAERHAEAELREAAHELQEARHAGVEIVVNAQPRTVHGREVTFGQIVQLAFPGVGADQNVVFSMTYRHAASVPHAGELASGGHVTVKKGSVFNVTRTVQS